MLAINKNILKTHKPNTKSIFKNFKVLSNMHLIQFGRSKFTTFEELKNRNKISYELKSNYFSDTYKKINNFEKEEMYSKAISEYDMFFHNLEFNINLLEDKTLFTSYIEHKIKYFNLLIKEECYDNAEEDIERFIDYLNSVNKNLVSDIVYNVQEEIILCLKKITNKKIKTFNYTNNTNLRSLYFERNFSEVIITLLKIIEELNNNNKFLLKKLNSDLNSTSSKNNSILNLDEINFTMNNFSILCLINKSIELVLLIPDENIVNKVYSLVKELKNDEIFMVNLRSDKETFNNIICSYEYNNLLNLNCTEKQSLEYLNQLIQLNDNIKGKK